MIKNSTYIRSFSALQREQMRQIQDEQKLDTVPKILFFALAGYHELRKDVDRLNRIIALKNKKIEQLKSDFDGGF